MHLGYIVFQHYIGMIVVLYKSTLIAVLKFISSPCIFDCTKTLEVRIICSTKTDKIVLRSDLQRLIALFITEIPSQGTPPRGPRFGPRLFEVSCPRQLVLSIQIEVVSFHPHEDPFSWRRIRSPTVRTAACHCSTRIFCTWQLPL